MTMINNYLTKAIPEGLQPYVNDSVVNNLGLFLLWVLMIMLYVAALLLLARFLRKFNRFIFDHLKRKKGKTTHLVFLEGAINAYIIVLAIIIPLAGDSIKKSILGSAAVLTAVVGFAAQDIIKDMLAGLLISIYKPFDIGDRIELEDGTVGIVESITMRHVVIIRIDTSTSFCSLNRLTIVMLISHFKFSVFISFTLYINNGPVVNVIIGFALFICFIPVIPF